MSNQPKFDMETELQLVELSGDKDEDKHTNMVPVDLISQYRILDKKCNEILKKIYHRRTTIKKN